jgi:hypothetical protein
MAGSKGAFRCNDKHMLPICNIVVKILNIVMSYTCLTGLSVEQQDTEFTMSTGYNSVIFPSFMVVSKKHYVGMLRDQSLYTKGMNYVRRTSISQVEAIANLQDIFESWCLTNHWPSCPRIPHCQAIQACHPMNLQGCVCWHHLPPIARGCQFLLGVLLPCQLPLQCHPPP